MVELGTKKGDGDAVFALGIGDHYTRYLEAGSAADFATMMGVMHYPGVRKFLENPAYTPFWSLQAVDKWLEHRPVTVPTMIEVGQWDQEDSYGGPAVYRAHGSDGQEQRHGIAAHRPVAPLGRQPLRLRPGRAHLHGRHGARVARELREAVLRPPPEGRPGSENSAGAHLRHGHQPVADVATAGRWASRGLSTWARAAGCRFEKQNAGGHEDYISDPARPVPFIPRPVDMGDADQWKPWLIRDQRFVSERPDVASWKSAPLTKPLQIMGAPEVALFASTTGTDSDWVVKLIDVYPNDTPEPSNQGAKPAMAGYELPIGIEIFRGRYLKSFAQPSPLKPGKVERYAGSCRT